MVMDITPVNPGGVVSSFVLKTVCSDGAVVHWQQRSLGAGF